MAQYSLNVEEGGEAAWPCLLYSCVGKLHVLDHNIERCLLWNARAELQIATTQDYATDSWFWTVFTGALNHQTTHHLFPGVIQSHYMKITPIVKQTCEEFGLKYHYVDTTTEAIGCHFNHLKALGQDTKKSDWENILSNKCTVLVHLLNEAELNYFNVLHLALLRTL